MQDGAKTRVSKSSVMMHLLLAEVMKAWQMATLYGKPDDYVFASYKLGGRKPRTGSMIVDDYLRPAAIKAKVITVDGQGQTFDLDCNKIKRFGFHVFRHSLCSFLMAEGENPAVIQATLRHTRLDLTMYYAHSRRKQKLDSGPPVANGGCNGSRKSFSSNEADGELVYNDELTAFRGA